MSAPCLLIRSCLFCAAKDLPSASVLCILTRIRIQAGKMTFSQYSFIACTEFDVGFYYRWPAHYLLMTWLKTKTVWLQVCIMVVTSKYNSACYQTVASFQPGCIQKVFSTTDRRNTFERIPLGLRDRLYPFSIEYWALEAGQRDCNKEYYTS